MSQKKFTLIAFLCVIIFYNNTKAQESDSLSKKRIESVLNHIRQQYAPDARTEIFKHTWNAESIQIESTRSDALNAAEKALKDLDITVKTSLKALPDKALNDQLYAVATLSVCNNKTKPSHASEMATQMMLGTPVQIIQKQGEWYQIRTPDGYIAWTEARGIAPMNKQQFDTWQLAPKIIYTGDFGYANEQANQSSNHVFDLVKGNIVELLATKGKYYYIKLPDNRTAYIDQKSAEPFTKWTASRNPSASNIINTARTMLGTPYLWGGSSIKGVDCSGFIKTSFFLNGVILPRDASQQALVGEKIDIYGEDGQISQQKCIQNLQTGDLMFFSSEREKGVQGRVTHVAMYIGNGEFIHSAGLVRINSLKPEALNYADYQSRTLTAARRILTQIGTKEITPILQNTFYQP